MRTCGTCQLCCKLIPVLAVGKAQNQKCEHQSFAKGCKIVGHPARPGWCSGWQCGWLAGFYDGERPDRAGYIVDPIKTFVAFGADAASGEKVDAVQVWATEKAPKEWLVLKNWLVKIAETNAVLAVVRFPGRTLVITPPQLSDTGDWKEVEARTMTQGTARAASRDYAVKNFERLREDVKRSTELADQPAADGDDGP